MRIMLKPLLASFAVSTLIGGCAITPHTEKLKYEPLMKEQRPIIAESAATYVREVTPDEESLKIKVSYVGTGSLIDAIRGQLPKLNILPSDTNVDLLKKVSVYANKMPLEDYLEYLSSLTGYKISLENNNVLISSFVEKEWNISLFSSTRNTSLKAGSAIGGGGGGNTVATESDVDEWKSIIEGTESIILNVEEADKKGMAPYVQSLRSVGTLSAGGNPVKMDAVDQFIRNIIEKGSRQVNISVQAYDVILDDVKRAACFERELESKGCITSVC
mgnify:CR=1 FL=1